MQNHEVRGILYAREYDWEGDRPLRLPYHRVIAYSLHVRGFTKHFSSQVKNKGTFLGVVEKIPYLTELGINQIHLMPVYDFEECLQYRNYWGYGDAYCFAPKASYSASGDAVRELKDMVKACHKGRNRSRAGDAFYWDSPQADDRRVPAVLHDGIPCGRIHPEPCGCAHGRDLCRSGSKKTKIMVHRQLGFQTVMRRFLKGDEGMVPEVMHWLRHNSREEGIFNYIANHNGFTLCDLVSYDGKQ